MPLLLDPTQPQLSISNLRTKNNLDAGPSALYSVQLRNMTLLLDPTNFQWSILRKKGELNAGLYTHRTIAQQRNMSLLIGSRQHKARKR
jgi:hypothetical protein